MKDRKKFSNYANAKIQVENLKVFYRHLTVYLTVNIGLLLIKSNIFDFLVVNGTHAPDFLNWIYWNIIATPLLWGIGLLFHGLYVFKFLSLPIPGLKPKILREWEEEQIQKYMEGNRGDSKI